MNKEKSSLSVSSMLNFLAEISKKRLNYMKLVDDHNGPPELKFIIYEIILSKHK